MPIKLKLNLSSASIPHAGPSTATASSSTTPLPSSKKGKGKAANHGEGNYEDEEEVIDISTRPIANKPKLKLSKSKSSLKGSSLSTGGAVSTSPVQPKIKLKPPLSPIAVTRLHPSAQAEYPSSPTIADDRGDDDDDEEEFEDEVIYAATPAIPTSTKSPAQRPSKASTPRSAKPPTKRSAPKSTPKGRVNNKKPRLSKAASAKLAKTPLSAIPPHVLSAGSTPKIPATPLPLPPPETPIPIDSPKVKLEMDIDDSPSTPINHQEDVKPNGRGEYFDTPTDGSRSGIDGQFEGEEDDADEMNLDGYTPMETPLETPTPIETPNTAGHKTGGTVKRLKKPLRELIPKVFAEIRRRDDYALFEDPVDLEIFPDYLDVIGGEDKMMDLSTMQSKFDNGEYRDLGQLEDDVRMLVTAAQKFNPPGTIPHKQATNILNHATKLIEKFKPIVMTPSPSPGRGSASRGQSMYSGREATVATDGGAYRNTKIDIPPYARIPEEMLNFPPNSLEALAVGWNLTGGRRIHQRKVIRSREKFPPIGSWRNWTNDGSRDLAEMEYPDKVFQASRNRIGYVSGNREVVDWKSLRRQGHWWDADKIGGVIGQPPIPMTEYPRLKPFPTKYLENNQFGLYPEIDAQMTFIANEKKEKEKEKGEIHRLDILEENVLPIRPRKAVKVDKELVGKFQNVYEDEYGRESVDWLRDVQDGGVMGEAYVSSIDSFVKGALEGKAKRDEEKKGDVKDEVMEDMPDSDEIPLDQWVIKDYHHGILDSQVKQIIHRTQTALEEYSRNPPNTSSNVIANKQQEQRISDPVSESLKLQSIIDHIGDKLSIQRAFSTSNLLDLRPLLHDPEDFGYTGESTKLGLTKGLNNIWDRLDQLIRSQQSSHPIPSVSEKKVLEDKMNSLRLELISLIKCYPLVALKKMERKDAERLLPQGVWHFMAPLPQR